MSNHLEGQVSPYLLQHVKNPVDWYPWCEEAFEKARKEDKPVFLSIGYSTCHWCHVMAHESFEKEETARLLNESFVAIKVDKEERPDIDSIYMTVCQAFTGSGGWPTSIFMTPEQKPFFAGTYFPAERRFGNISFTELLTVIRDRWESDRKSLIQTADGIVEALKQEESRQRAESDKQRKQVGSGQKFSEQELEQRGSQQIQRAAAWYQQSFDAVNGGFGNAPKFPTPHDLLFLLSHYEKSKDKRALEMVEKTLQQMYRGGIFDHIGGGFSRYSTDDVYLVPHFEKMLYDNALLILAYCKAAELTGKSLYQNVAERTADYVLREMTSRDGGFYCGQDADSQGEEGKYYTFQPAEIQEILGKEAAEAFCSYYDVTESGNFEGKSIPNLLKNSQFQDKYQKERRKLYEYRLRRVPLHLDDKVLTSWNGLMIAALCRLYGLTGKREYQKAAKHAADFIEINLCEKDTLYVSYRKGKRSIKGFLDAYGNYIFALLMLYDATLENRYLKRAGELMHKVMAEFWDEEQGGFFLYGKENEQLITRPKELYDGAIPSGNSMMAYNMVRLNLLEQLDLADQKKLLEHLTFLAGQTEQEPAGHSMYFLGLYDWLEPPVLLTVVKAENTTREELDQIPIQIQGGSIIKVLEQENVSYPLKDQKTTYYICKDHSCQPPVNELG